MPKDKEVSNVLGTSVAETFSDATWDRMQERRIFDGSFNGQDRHARKIPVGL